MTTTTKSSQTFYEVINRTIRPLTIRGIGERTGRKFHMSNYDATFIDFGGESQIHVLGEDFFETREEAHAAAKSIAIKQVEEFEKIATDLRKTWGIV